MHNSAFQKKINVFLQKLKWCTCNCNLSSTYFSIFLFEFDVKIILLFISKSREI